MLFTLFFVGLLASAAVAQNQKPGKPIQFAQDKTYVYEYSARLLTGIPELADQYAGFEMNADLVLQARSNQAVDLKLTNIKVGRTNDASPSNYEEDLDMVHRWNKEYQRELTKPIRFVHEDGKVKSFQAERNEPDWSLNIKKSILSLFNINLTPEKIIRAQQGNLVPKPLDASDLTYYGVYERGMGGICETVYEIDQIPDPKNPIQEHAFVLNVTKTRNYDNCLTEPTLVKENFDQRGCPAVCRKERSFAAVRGYHPVPDAVSHHANGCQCGHEAHASPVDQYNFVKYNVSLVAQVPVIESLLSEGKVVYNTFGDKIMVVTHQNATLQKLLPSRQITLPQIQDPKRHEELAFRIPKPTIPNQSPVNALDIPYLALFGQPDVPELAENLPRLFEKLASDIIAADPSSSKDSMHYVLQIVNTLSVMPQEALEQLYKDVAQKGRDENANDKEKVIRKLFLDALPLSGSNPAAKLIKQLTVSNLLTKQEAKQMIEAVPQNMYLPDVQTIQAYLELAQNQRLANKRHLKASVAIAFAKLVRQGCVVVKQQPGDIPSEDLLPRQQRNKPAQQVIARAADATVERRIVAERRINKRSAPWNAAFTQDVCSQRDLERFVQIAAQRLEAANTFEDKLIAIETLAHMGVPQALKHLAPYVTGTATPAQLPGYPLTEEQDPAEEADFIRQNAIYALSHIAEENPKQVLPLVLPVFRDQSESYENRIAAFTIIMLADPEPQILESIAAELHRENNKQVTSFVLSAFEHVANLTTPCFKHTAHAADEAATFAPKDALGMQYSKFIAKDYFDKERDFGLFLFNEWVANNQSAVPRSAYFSIGQTNGPFHDELLQVGFTQKGMESILKRIVGKKGLIKDMLEGLNAKTERRLNRNTRNTDSVDQALEALKTKLNLRPRHDDDPKATVFFKLFERTSYFALDEAHLKEVIDQAEDTLKDWAEKLIAGYSGHFVKVLMPASLYKVVPTEMGLPVVISHKHPIVLSLKVDQAKLDLTASPKTAIPIGFNLTAQITPQVMYSSFTFMFGVAPANRVAYGTHVEKTSLASLPMEISIGHVRPKELWTLSIVPKVPHEVVLHKSEAKTFIARTKIAAAPTRDWLEDSKTIKTMAAPFRVEKRVGQKALGLGLHIELNSEDEWHRQPAWRSETAKKQGVIAALIEELRNPGLQARELHVTLEADEQTPTYGIDATFRYKWTADEENEADEDDSDESSATNESDSDESDESSSSRSSESSESNSSRSVSKSNNSKSKSKRSSESNSSSSSSSSDDSSSASTSDSSSSSSSSKSVSKQVKDARRIKGLKKAPKSIHIHRHGSGSKSTSSSSASSSSASLSASSSQESNSSPDSSSQSSSSESSSSSSSSEESDESFSMEDGVFDYEDIMELITGHSINEHNIKKIALHLIKKTRSSWSWAWDADESSESSSSSSSSSSDSSSSSSHESKSRSSSESSSESDDSDSSSSDKSESRSSKSANSRAVSKAQSRQSEEKDIIPAFETHDVVITLTARGPRPTFLAVNMMLVHTIDRRAMWVKADAHIKTPEGIYLEVPTLACLDGVVAFPQLPGEFYFDQTTQQEAKARIKAQLGWGEQCHKEGGIIVTGQLEKTEDKVWRSEDFSTQDGATELHNQPWFYHKCQEDRSEGKPASYACERAIIEESYFNQLTLDVKYKNVPKEIKNLTRKADLALKVKLYNNLEENAVVENPKDQLRIVAQFSNQIPDVPMVNLRIAKPTEETRYSKVFAPFFRPVSTLLPLTEVYKNLLTNYDNTPACQIMEQAVRTFDNVTYDLPENNCQVLIAKDCSHEEKFTVYSTVVDPAANTKKVHILVAGKEIMLMPPQEQDLMQIEVNGQVQELTADKPITFSESSARGQKKAHIALRKTKSDAVRPIAVVRVPEEGLEVLYDGKNIKVLIKDHMYRGKTCGICGNNDKEEEDEFEGPAKCIHEDAEDFVASYSMAGEHCEEVPRPKGKVRCPPVDQRRKDRRNQLVHKVEKIRVQNQIGGSEIVRESVRIPVHPRDPQSRRQEQQDKCQKMRTEYVVEGDMICFTTKPVNACLQGCRPTAEEEQSVEYHCLPKASPFTKQLQQEADKAVLKQLANKRVDFRRAIKVPLRCLA